MKCGGGGNVLEKRWLRVPSTFLGVEPSVRSTTCVPTKKLSKRDSWSRNQPGSLSSDSPESESLAFIWRATASAARACSSIST